VEWRKKLNPPLILFNPKELFWAATHVARPGPFFLLLLLAPLPLIIASPQY